MSIGDSMSFEWPINTPLKTGDAHRYVALSHTRDFWNHIATGTRKPANVKVMLEPDRGLCGLFNVKMGDGYTFHWTCFVFESQLILAMWCQHGDMQLPLTNIPSVFDTQELRQMTYFLFKWIEYHYNVVINVVLDVAPCEMLPTLVDVITWIAAKCDIKTTLNINEIPTSFAVSSRLNGVINNSLADEFFMYPITTMTAANADVIDIVQMYNNIHHRNTLFHDDTQLRTTFSSHYARIHN